MDVLNSQKTPENLEKENKDKPLYGELQLPFKHSYLNGHIYPPFVKVQ